LCQSGCQLGWGSSTPTYNINKTQYKPKVQKYKKKTNKSLKKTSRAEQPLTKQMRFERRPEKTCQKKPLWGKKCAGKLGRSQGSNSKRLEAHPRKALQK